VSPVKYELDFPIPEDIRGSKSRLLSFRHVEYSRSGKQRRVHRYYPTFGHRPVFYLKHDVSETRDYLRLQVEPIEMRSIEYVPPENGDGFHSPKRRVLNKRQNSG
jgi:hypothetical protein